MREFKKVNKVFIKSDNSTLKIYNRYLYCLMPFIFVIFLYNFIWGDRVVIINLIKSISISLSVGILSSLIFNIIKKEKSFIKSLFKYNILTIGIIIGMFSMNVSSLIVIIASFISIFVRYFMKNITISASLYGILIILFVENGINNLDTPLNNLANLSYVDTFDNVVRSYGSILSYLLGFKYYFSPMLSIIVFIYLFFKKSIKYNIVISYLGTFSLIMLCFGMFNNMNIWYVLFQLCTGNILFLSMFCLVDYLKTPITYEGQIVYGILLGVITSVFRFIEPELAVVVTLILGPFMFTKVIDKFSYKLKYNNKFYYLTLLSCLLLIIGVIVGLNIFI